MKTKATMVLLGVGIILALISGLNARTIEGEVSLGHLFTDESGSRAVNSETFNVYEGFDLSFTDMKIRFAKGFRLNGNFENVTQNNRNINFVAAKPGLVNLSVSHNKYRRLYSADGRLKTDREATSVNAYVIPLKYVKVRGGFFNQYKEGTSAFGLEPVIDTVVNQSDYTYQGYHFGASVDGRLFHVNGEFRANQFRDDLNFNRDKNISNLRLEGSYAVKNMERTIFGGGVNARREKLLQTSDKHKINTYWAAAQHYLTRAQMTLSYRFVHYSDDFDLAVHEESITQHSLSVAKTWYNQGNLRVGYEYGKRDDGSVEESSDGFFLDAWVKLQERWRLSGRYTNLSKDVDRGQEVAGNRLTSRWLLSARYTDPTWGMLESRFEQRSKDYRDLGSQIDYTSASLRGQLTLASVGSATASYSYHLGDYTNVIQALNYKFADHVVTMSIMPRTYHHLTVQATSTYYRSLRNNNLEKFFFSGMIDWEFIKEHHFRGRYEAYTLDDLMIVADTYTGNFVKLEFIKDLSI